MLEDRIVFRATAGAVAPGPPGHVSGPPFHRPTKNPLGSPGSGRGVGLEPVLQGGIHARLPAFASGLKGFYDIGVIP